MSDKELMQQALEALEINNQAWKQLADSGDAGFWEAEEQPFYGTSVKAMNALRERLAQPEQDWDWRHPKAQALIGAKARLQIKLRLVEQLLEDPHFETTASDMEYWEPLHDKLQERLAQPEQSPLDRMAENARELGLDYEPTGIAVSKVWWDGETLRAEAIPVEQVYKQPVQEPECCPDTAKCLSAGVCIAKHGQEPVAWADMDVRGEDKGLSWTPGHFHKTPLYTTPPRREWQGLTDEEIKAMPQWFPSHETAAVMPLIRAMEAKLKERNNG